jgi:hypothetical protein
VDSDEAIAVDIAERCEHGRQALGPALACRVKADRAVEILDTARVRPRPAR